MAKKTKGSRQEVRAAKITVSVFETERPWNAFKLRARWNCAGMNRVGGFFQRELSTKFPVWTLFNRPRKTKLGSHRASRVSKSLPIPFFSLAVDEPTKLSKFYAVARIICALDNLRFLFEKKQNFVCIQLKRVISRDVQRNFGIFIVEFCNRGSRIDRLHF